jgi:hypothetical protein
MTVCRDVDNARCHAASPANRVVVTKPITFLIIEMGSTADSNAFRNKWLSWGWEDVTPIYGKRKSVKAWPNAKGWTEFKDACRSVEADWIFISGHHGRQYASDWRPPGDHRDDAVNFRSFNRQAEAGFFNNTYHHGQWDHASLAKPDEHKLEGSIYLSTTASGKNTPETDNPFYGAPHPATKGVILSACNTLIYKHTRLALRKYFPNAIMIGTWSKTKVGGTAFSNPVLKGTDKQFFVSPPTDPAQIAHFTESIAKLHFAKSMGIGLQHGDKIWGTGEDKKAFDIPITYDWNPEAPGPSAFNAY